MLWHRSRAQSFRGADGHILWTMNKQNLKIIHDFVRKKGDEIQPILPILQQGVARQAQAHLYKAIKDSFGVPCKDVPDGRFDEVMRVLTLCVEHAYDPHVERNHLGWVVPEPEPATLEIFFENS